MNKEGNREQLLAEVEDVLRNAPMLSAFAQDSGGDEHLAWLGRAAAAIERWNYSKMPTVAMALSQVPSDYLDPCSKTLSTIKILLQQARADLRLEVGQLSVLVDQGQVFDYFDELRKVIETARSEIFFVDAYLDTEFVSRYLPHAPSGVGVRLLGGPKRMPTLLSAVDLFARQHAIAISVRSSDNLHDRFLFVDGTACYLSGASFKDGAKNAPAVLTQITDAFQSMWDTYDNLWKTAKTER
jgi:hypothetical protein